MSEAYVCWLFDAIEAAGGFFTVAGRLVTVDKKLNPDERLNLKFDVPAIETTVCNQPIRLRAGGISELIDTDGNTHATKFFGKPLTKADVVVYQLTKKRT